MLDLMGMGPDSVIIIHMGVSSLLSSKCNVDIMARVHTVTKKAL